MDRLNPLLTRIEAWPVTQLALRHPRLSAWIVLAGGMDAMLAWEARDVGLLPGQWIALMTASTLVAGACIWIISWEDRDEDEEKAGDSATASDQGG
ncbi:MAG: hypothetical protein OXP68_06180 [Anaerolineaceae bacterium]|nr:hypothetical protein [Anaerolineaceae bacterium]MDE0327473.1 hypothetical protein [Anaerolineaceae bacterium]